MTGRRRHLRFAAPRNLRIDAGFSGGLSGMLVLDISARQWEETRIEVSARRSRPDGVMRASPVGLAAAHEPACCCWLEELVVARAMHTFIVDPALGVAPESGRRQSRERARCSSTNQRDVHDVRDNCASWLRGASVDTGALKKFVRTNVTNTGRSLSMPQRQSNADWTDCQALTRTVTPPSSRSQRHAGLRQRQTRA